MAKSAVRVLFLCTGNSCRSQMAEGWARALLGAKVEAHSAGVEAHGLNPHAVQVMREAGIDISRQRSKRVEDLAGLMPDVVVTVCDRAAEACPVFPGAPQVLHRDFRDPARAVGSDAEVLAEFRAVRDEIRDFVRELPNWMREGRRDASD